MSNLFAQLGVKNESTYGAAVAVDRFFEFGSESVIGDYQRIESEAIRAGSRVLPADRWAVNPKGAAGDLSLEVTGRGFGFWLAHMLGTVTTEADTPGAGKNTHTGTVGSLDGRSFTLQVGRPDVGNVVRPYTYAGGKVASFEISNSVDGILMLKLSTDFATETMPVASPAGVYALQTVAYPAAPNQLLTFVGGTVTVASVEVVASEVTFSVDSGLRLDRYGIRSAAGKREPRENARRSIEWGLTAEFEGLTQVSRVASATRSGATASIVAVWQTPDADATLTVTIPAARFDSPSAANVEGAETSDLSLSGIGLDNGTDSPISIKYVTADATP
ncbi:phage tail tube protein [Parafrankia sp. EUN1f]|uniref:phage tail tube protein n=1 Tax=Parafrankia sp. EUN1f TaxID=102897 RepID=UPI0001C4557B|nr:phage tail tube protein [Parafrankia sp. EUN1f]EFC86466.1 hypothetical protein FrEUN1fDRAFT_0361 [Parafrankia sp. EUN1f]